MMRARLPGILGSHPLGTADRPGRVPGILGTRLPPRGVPRPRRPAVAPATLPRAPALAPRKGQLPLEEAQQIAPKITTCFEGGKTLNYAAVAGDFDGQGVSFGLIQWNFGQDTLGPLLKKMLARDARAFAACFRKEADYEGLKKALDANSASAQLKWARAQQAANPAWKATFSALGAVDAFNAIQRTEACGKYHPLAVRAIARLRGIAKDLLAEVELRSYVALFDLCVQQHGLDKALDTIARRAALERPRTQLDLLKIAVVERGKVASQQWAADCISRRLGILGGAPVEVVEFDIRAKRNNAQLALLGGRADARVQGL